MAARRRRLGACPRLAKESFGQVLRAGRERRQVSLDDLSSATRVRTDVWTALEANELSAWPRGIYARSWIRQYAEQVDLDPDWLVNEFCRLFPNGDRRSEPLLREFAAIVAHDFADCDHEATPRRRTGDLASGCEPLEDRRHGVTRAVPPLQEWARRRAAAVIAMYRVARSWTLARRVARSA